MNSGAACLLGSINLDRFVKNPFTNKAEFNFEKLQYVTTNAVIALNKVLDEGIQRHPLQIQKDTARDWRQIGLGTTGLATCLIRLGLIYGSNKSLEMIQEIYHVIARTAISTSAWLAKRDGMYPKCKPETIVKSSFFQQFGFDDEFVNTVKEYGLRNSQLLTCAPNGTIGTMIGTGSTGIESIFALSYNRTTKSLHDKDVIYKIEVPIIKEYRDVTGNNGELPGYFVSVKEIPYIDRLKVQATAQQYIDGSISSTCNIPENITVDEVENLYLSAWKLGCKGTTIFRENCKRTAILSTSSSNKGADNDIEKERRFDYIKPISRKTMGTTQGMTFAKKTACGTLYITINKDSNGNIVETFINTSKGGICQANVNAINRMVSCNLRAGVQVDEVIDQLKGISCPACLKTLSKGNKLDGISCPDILGKTLEEFKNCTIQSISIGDRVEEKIEEGSTEVCPECGQPLQHSGGCVECSNCFYSKCE